MKYCPNWYKIEKKVEKSNYLFDWNSSQVIPFVENQDDFFLTII